MNSEQNIHDDTYLNEIIEFSMHNLCNYICTTFFGTTCCKTLYTVDYICAFLGYASVKMIDVLV